MLNRPSRTLTLLSITGCALAAWLILYGLQLRFFGSFIRINTALAWLTPPHNFVTWVGLMGAGISTADMGWPLLVLGCSLLGAIAGLCLRQSWAPRSLLFLSIASLITFHWMNFLSILLLVFARHKSIQPWLDQDPGIDG